MDVIFSNRALWLCAQAPNLRFYQKKLTSTLGFSLGQHPSGNLQPFSGKNCQPAGLFREEKLGKLRKIGYFGHVGNHKMHLEH